MNPSSTLHRLLVLAVASALAAPAAATDLMAVYELARASDPQLKAAEAQKFAVGEGVTQARSALLPQINGSAALTDSDSARNSFTVTPRPDGGVNFGLSEQTSDSRSREYRITLNQAVYDHANYTRLAAARAERSRAESEYEAALDGLFIRVAQAYFDTLTAQTNLEAAEAEEKAVGRQLEQAEQRFEVGLTAITDVHEARARFDSARANVILAKNQLDDAYEALVELTGQPLANLRPLREDIPLAMPEPADAEQWVGVGIDANPVLAARNHALSAAEQGIATAKAGRYPTLGLQAFRAVGDGWGSNSFGGPSFPGSSSSANTVIGLQLSIPIFSGFNTTSQIRQSVYRRDAAAEQYEQERRGITRQIRNAYRAVIAGMSEIEARRQALVSARSALEATQAGFEVGTRTIVDVLLSQQQLFAAQREYARSRHNFIVAGLRLKQSAGVIDIADIQAVNALLR